MVLCRLRRNDPFLSERPIIVSFFGMTKPEMEILQKTFPRSRIITNEGMARLQEEIAR
jgi:hypothetical protein